MFFTFSIFPSVAFSSLVPFKVICVALINILSLPCFHQAFFLLFPYYFCLQSFSSVISGQYIYAVNSFFSSLWLEARWLGHSENLLISLGSTILFWYGIKFVFINVKLPLDCVWGTGEQSKVSVLEVLFLHHSLIHNTAFHNWMWYFGFVINVFSFSKLFVTWELLCMFKVCFWFKVCSHRCQSCRFDSLGTQKSS